jgi:hypothetical protein
LIGGIKGTLVIRASCDEENKAPWDRLDNDLDLFPSQWNNLEELWTKFSSSFQGTGKSLPSLILDLVSTLVNLVDSELIWVGILGHVPPKGEDLLEFFVRNNRCARLTIDNIAILSPNHRSKPPSSILTLTERIILEANPRSKSPSR